MSIPTIVCGREFAPELIVHLNAMAQRQPPPSRNQLAREACTHLGWYSPNGRPAVSSAKVALRKLHRRCLLGLPARSGRPPAHHRLVCSGQPLPALRQVPRRVDQIGNVRLYLLSGHEDPLHGLWNDLIIAQHPCGDAPLVGGQLRYLVGSDHGWLGALGLGPAAFGLQSRDQWIGWSTTARLHHLKEVVGLARLLIRREVRCTNLVSKVLSLLVERVADDWQARYGVRPWLLESFVERDKFSGGCLGAANWLRVGVSRGRGRLGPKGATKALRDVWLYPLDRQARAQLQGEMPAPLRARSITEALAQPAWVGGGDGGGGFGGPTARAAGNEDSGGALAAAASQFLRQFQRLDSGQGSLRSDRTRQCGGESGELVGGPPGGDAGAHGGGAGGFKRPRWAARRVGRG